MTNFFNIYGFDDGGNFETFPEERREWRKHIEKHINKKTAEAISKINANTDEDVDDAKEFIDSQITAAKNSIESKITSAKDSIEGKITNVSNLIGKYSDSEQTQTVFGAIKRWRGII